MVHELGSEYRKTVRSIFSVDVRALRGPRRIHFWCTNYRAHGKCWVINCGVNNYRNHLSRKPIRRWVLSYSDFPWTSGSTTEAARVLCHCGDQVREVLRIQENVMARQVVYHYEVSNVFHYEDRWVMKLIQEMLLFAFTPFRNSH